MVSLMRNVVRAGASLMIGVVAACASSEETPPSTNLTPDDAGGETSVAAGSVVLASKQDKPWTIAIDANNVYWVNAGTLGGLYKVPKGGGATTPLYEGAVAAIESVGVDSTSVYFVLDDAIVAVPIAGGPLRTVASATGIGGSGVAVANGDVYWVTSTEPLKPSQLWRVSVNGGTPAAVALADELSPRGGAYFIAAAADGVYAGFHMGGVLRLPLDGAPPIYFPSRGPTKGIASDTTNVYFAAADTLTALPKGGGEATNLAPGGNPMGVAVDETSVYFNDNTPTGRVLKVQKAGGATAVIADQQGAPHAIAVDAASVYWNCIDEGTIKKSAK